KILNKKYGSILKLDTEKYCSFVQSKHEHNCMYVTITKNGWCLKCQKCPFEQYPEDDTVKVSNYILNNVFGINNVYNVTINNNNYNSPETQDTFTIHTAEYNVFEDKKLNELVYMSLNGTGNLIAKLIHYLYKERFRCT